MKELKLIGMQTWIHSISVVMRFANGEVKEVWENDLGFKVNDELNHAIVHVSGYKDKTEWNGTEHVVVGKDETQCVSATIEAPKYTIDEYMYKLGIFSESVDVNRQLREDRLQANIESTITQLGSSMSMLEHQLMKLGEKIENIKA